MRQHFRPEGADRQRIGQRPSQGQIDFVRELLPEKIAFGKFRDFWVERYLAFLRGEIDALGGDTIGRRYIDCELKAYSDLKISRKPADRFRAWFVIHSACRWLARVERGTR